MGSADMRSVFGVERPCVGLLADGEEENEGRHQPCRKRHQLLKARRAPPGLNFVGNVEGRDIYDGDVRTWWSATASSATSSSSSARASGNTFPTTPRSSTAGPIEHGRRLLGEPSFDARERVDYEQVRRRARCGVTVLDHPHGRCRRKAIKNAIRVAVEVVDADMSETIREGCRASARRQARSRACRAHLPGSGDRGRRRGRRQRVYNRAAHARQEPSMEEHSLHRARCRSGNHQAPGRRTGPRALRAAPRRCSAPSWRTGRTTRRPRPHIDRGLARMADVASPCFDEHDGTPTSISATFHQQLKTLSTERQPVLLRAGCGLRARRACGRAREESCSSKPARQAHRADRRPTTDRSHSGRGGDQTVSSEHTPLPTMR